MDDIIADVSMSHLCDGSKEVFNLTGQIRAFELKQVGLQIVKVERCRLKPGGQGESLVPPHTR